MRINLGQGLLFANRRRIRNSFRIVPAAVLLLLTLACTKDQAPAPVAKIDPSEHVGRSPVGTDQVVLQKTFNLKTSATFPFEIPAHAVSPHLHGIFQSFVHQVHGTSDDSANVDFMILNEEQNTQMESNRPSDTLFSVEASHNQAVNFDLPASMNQPVKYYLVFRSSDGGKSAKAVEANFRVDY